ncbi:MAG: transglutaminase-like domain-containing protein [Spirosomataceae bacterium]
MQKGGIGTVSYHEHLKNPYMLTGFIFGNYYPIVKSEFSVTFPSTVKVSYKTYNDMKGIVFSQTTKNGQTTYSWKAQDLSSLPLETESPSLRHYAPQVFLFIESYTANGKTTEVLGNVPKLFNYYKSLVKDLNKTPNPTLKALTDSLTNGKTEMEKIRSVYYWVQDHIKYIAFEEGLGGFVPRQAAEVCQKRYGDCKDMASLTSTMLNLAGIPAYLVWIGTRDIPYRYQENPSMSVDNHMIAAIKYKGKWEFLDATDDRIDFGLPTSHIQGKEALVMTSEDKYEIVPVPIVPAKANFKRDSIVLALDGKTLKGQGQLSFEGLWKASMKSAVQYRSESQRNEYYKSLLGRGSNKCTLDKTAVSGIQQREVPVVFDYDFSVPDYVQEAAGELFVNPHLTRTWADKRQEDTRKNDWKHEYAHAEETVSILKIPLGYEVTYLPENVSFSHPDFGFKMNYEQKNGQVIAHTYLTLNTLLVKKSTFSEWNKMVTALNEAYSEVVSLKKKS